ncbi:MAG: NTP transferase domain-containing protein [Candidatus Hydrogenedentes bacterium]|nr:NTP transferase domain-containing protein [Candidatus Hydrogenedentota bacterium]
MAAISSYQGVILAAGHGSRMGPFGERMPKPIAPICNKPLMAYQLEHLRSLGIEDVIVVIGHLGHRISETLGNGSAYGVRIQYVEQQERLGLAHAVGQLERHITRPFVLFLGDIFFQVNALERMISEFETHDAAAVLAVKEEDAPALIKKNFSVALRPDGTVQRVIEKPRHIENKLKGCGLYLFDERVFDGIRRTPRTAMRDEYELTDSIQILIDYDYPVRIAPVVEWDVNLTFIGDLIDCCVHELRTRGQQSLVGRDCRLVEGVQLVETVLGDRVCIEHPLRLERCVVLDDVVLSGTQDCRDLVLSSEGPLHAQGPGGVRPV